MNSQLSALISPSRKSKYFSDATALSLSLPGHSVSATFIGQRLRKLAIQCRDERTGMHLGTVSFPRMPHRVADRVLRSLAARPVKLPADPDVSEKTDPLFRALWAAESGGVRFRSNDGNNRFDIHTAIEERRIATLTQEQLMADIVVAQPVENVVHLAFPNRFRLTYSLMRVQEHYESPEYAGKIFSRSEFKAWFAGTQEHGAFSYYQKWSGFNFPGEILKPFRNGSFDPLDMAERAALEVLRNYSGRFYVIATILGSDDGTLRHEVAHGLYYTQPEYRKAVDELLEGQNLSAVEGVLQLLGYSRDKFRDECHAYILNDLKWLESRAGIEIEPFRDLSEKLNRVFAKFSDLAPVSTL